MAKRNYVFNYSIVDVDSDTLVFRTHAVRAMSEKEAYSRFRHWIKYRDDKTYIVGYALDANYKDSNYDKD